jgi:hypothetical protein
MRTPVLVAYCLFMACAVSSGQEKLKEYRLKLSLDPLLELGKTWALGEKEIEAQFHAEGFKPNPYVRWSEDKGTALFSSKPFSNITVDLSVLEGAIPLDGARLVLDKPDGKVSRVVLSAALSTKGELERLRLKAASLVGGEAKPGPRPALGWKADMQLQSEMWSGTGGTVILETAENRALLCYGRPGVKPAELIEGKGRSASVAEDGKLEFFVRFDQLLAVPDAWALTPDDLSARADAQGLGMKENPFFKWNSGAKDSARFSRNLFGNTKTDLLLFNDSVHAEEVNVEFIGGRASRVVVTLLSRGNSGAGITAATFNETTGAAARALGTMLGVRPTHTVPAGMMLVKADGYLWTTPHTLALLEYNADAPKGKVEFVRLTLTPASARKQLMNSAGIGNFATTRNLISLMGSVKRDKTTNEVEITGIPMRDQGQKGYCVAASCERLLRYLGQPCDMDELAQLVDADAQRGASPRVMYGALAKIDQRYNLNLTLMMIAPGHLSGMQVKNKSELEHAKKADLGKIISEAIDHGVPLLWGVELPPGETGLAPQPGTTPQPVPPPRSVPSRPGLPPIPMAMQSTRAGHLRMIIGYNSKTGAVIYTDSWGAGHERKVMPYAQAVGMTAAVFSMKPVR